MPDSLTPYKGKQVVSTAISLRNAGDGLSKAMNVDPYEYDHGDTVYIVIEAEVTQHVHKPLKDTADLELVQVMSAGRATLVEKDLVLDLLNAQQDRIDEAAGIEKLPYTEDGDDE